MYMHVEASVWYMAIFLQSIFLPHLVIIPLTDATPTICDMIYMTNNVPAAVRDGQGYLVHLLFNVYTSFTWTDLIRTHLRLSQVNALIEYLIEYISEAWHSRAWTQYR